MEESNTQKWLELHLKYADDYWGDMWGHRWRASQQFRYKVYKDMLGHILPSERKLRILDVGCALGDFTQVVHQLDPKNTLVGVDISESVIERLNARYKSYTNISFKVGALPNLPFNPVSFDVVLCLDTLFYLNHENREKAVINIKEILKKGGYVLISSVLDDGTHYFKEDEFIRLISAHFKIIKIRYIYNRLYNILEGPFLRLVRFFRLVHDDKYRDILSHNKKRPLLETISKLPGCKMVAGIGARMLRALLSWEAPVNWLNKVSRALWGGMGKSHIVILGKRIS